MRKTILANAKINIGLNILEKLPNGYHSLDMIMAPIDLADKMEIEYFQEDGELIITSNKLDIPTDENNIIWKIWDAYYKKTKLKKKKIKIHLIKKIPHEAGLGGGSADGGAFLKELNTYNDNLLTLNEMIELSKNIGADIPFFLINKTSRAKGIGEKLEIIENNIDGDIILIKPNFGVSAGEAYSNYTKLNNSKFANIEKISEGLKENNIYNVLNNIENHLEQGLLLTNKDIIEFKKKLSLNSNQKFFMSGSGSTYFTVVQKSLAQKTYITLKSLFKDCEVYLCKFL